MHDASLWVMSGKICFENVPGWWAHSSGYGLWIRFCQWQTTDYAALATLTVIFKEYKELLIDSINNLTQHLYLVKAQAGYMKSKKNLSVQTRLWCLGTSQRTTSIWSRMRYKASTVAKSIAHCIPKSSTTKMLMETSNIIPSISFQMTTHTTTVLFTRFRHYWWNSWRRGSQTSQRSITFLMVVVGNIKISRTSLIYVSIKRTFQWIFFETSHGKSPCDGIGGAVKCHAAKRSL